MFMRELTTMFFEGAAKGMPYLRTFCILLNVFGAKPLGWGQRPCWLPAGDKPVSGWVIGACIAD